MSTRKHNEEKSLAALAQLRNRLSQRKLLEPNLINRDVFLLRYIRDTNNNVNVAERMLENYAKICMENEIDTLISSVSPLEVSENFVCFLGGVDYENRPVLQLPCTKNYDLRRWVDCGYGPSFEEYFMKIHWIVERTLLENNVEFAVLIVDLKEISYTQFIHHKSFMTIMHVVQRIQKFSPGTVQRAIVVNAPRTLKIILAAARKLITINAEIILFSENQTNWREKILDYVPRNQLCPAFGGTSTTCYPVK